MLYQNTLDDGFIVKKTELQLLSNNVNNEIVSPELDFALLQDWISAMAELSSEGVTL